MVVPSLTLWIPSTFPVWFVGVKFFTFRWIFWVLVSKFLVSLAQNQSAKEHRRLDRERNYAINHKSYMRILLLFEYITQLKQKNPKLMTSFVFSLSWHRTPYSFYHFITFHMSLLVFELWMSVFRFVIKYVPASCLDTTYDGYRGIQIGVHLMLYVCCRWIQILASQCMNQMT